MSDEDRPRRSWREIDQMRGQARPTQRERKPRGKAAEARAQAATTEYLKEVDKLFSSEKGGAEGEAVTRALRNAHGSAELPGACRAYRDALGMPDDPGLVQLFLDSGDAELVVAALDGLLSAREAGTLELSSGLKSQLRVLAQGFDDDIASRAEELLEDL